MSETQVLSKSAPWTLHKTESQVRPNSLRFTPLRSAVIARKRHRATGSDRILSRLVPDRRLQS